MPSLLTLIAAGAVALITLALIVYIWIRYYEARHDRTFMTQDERGFKRALRGRGVLWDFEESVVKGPAAPHIEFVALDPATGGRRAVKLMDERSGAINLRPHYCAPLPFDATTADAHKVIIDCRVQFSLNRELLKHVYEIQEFSLALETRIQSAFRSEIGKRKDEELRAALSEVERGVIEQLRTHETEGDEAGELGMALGVRWHTANFSFTQQDAFAESPFSGNAVGPVLAALPADATPQQQAAAVRALSRTQGVLSLRPQQIDQLADAFRDRDPAALAALMQLLDMQTRQNIAEALAQSGQLLVLTPQELGLIGAAAQRDALTRRALSQDAHNPGA